MNMPGEKELGIIAKAICDTAIWADSPPESKPRILENGT